MNEEVADKAKLCEYMHLKKQCNYKSTIIIETKAIEEFLLNIRVSRFGENGNLSKE